MSSKKPTDSLFLIVQIRYNVISKLNARLLSLKVYCVRFSRRYSQLNGAEVCWKVNNG